MRATVVYLSGEHKVISARSNTSLSNKLAHIKIAVSPIDLLFMSMTKGYTNVDGIKINVTAE